MEIIRQNETFTLKETTDAYEMNGTANRETSGVLSININVARVGGESVGNCYYNKYSDNDNVHFSLTCAEVVREELAAYADSVIDSVLEYFKANN